MADDVRITVDEVRQKQQAGEKVTFIDTRNPQAWGESDKKLPGALRFGPKEIEHKLGDLARNSQIVTYCTWPGEGSSAGLAHELRKHGFTNAFALKGGFDAWRDAGMPLDDKQKAAWRESW